jgi:hypothetical protein
MQGKTRIIFDDHPHGGIMFPGANWVVSAWDCENVARWFRTGVPLGRIPSTIRDLMLAGFCLLFAIGCGATELPSPEVQARASELSALLTSTKTVETKSDEILKVVESNTTALAAIQANIEALQVKSETPKGQEVIQSSEPPATANNTPNSSQVATPAASSHVASDGTRLKWDVQGNWNPTILETSRHLGADHGINTNGMTHQEMADIHADLHDGKTSGGAPVGAIFPNNRASAITSQRTSVRSLPQRVSFFGRAKYSTRQSCPSGRCPTR